MKAVWSFWSKPFDAHHKRVWLSGTHHLLSWVLSVETAKRHYSTTALVTDGAGLELLVDRLGLRFTTVSTDFDALHAADPDWWVLGKLRAYAMQTEPFVHLDNDVFLWARLPDRVERADVFAQSPESFSLGGESWYRPTAFANALRAASGWAPEEWWWSVTHGVNHALCCGIVGGCAVDFLSYFGDVAVRMIEHPRNRSAWAAVGGTIGDNILLEQYLLAACVCFHRQDPRSKYGELDVRYLFESTDAAFDESAAAAVGYTHLIGAAKTNPALMNRLAARVERDYPHYYERCLELS